jgi:ADP-heptose:LPS heptosyltransferase
MKMLNIIPEPNIITLNKKTLGALAVSLVRFLLLARKIGFDTVFDFEFFSRFSTIVAFLTGAQRRIGFYGFANPALYRGDLLTHKVPFNHMQHVSQNFISLTGALSCGHEADKFRKKAVGNLPNIREILPVSRDSEVKDSLIKKIGNILKEGNIETASVIVISPAVSDLGRELRMWEEEKFALLAEKILAKDDKAAIIFIGAKGDERIVNEILDHIIQHKNRVVNLAGLSTVRELVELFSFSKLIVTLDSGPMHLASLTDVNIVSLFSTESPLFFGPLSDKNVSVCLNLSCQPCLSIYNGKIPFCHDNKCMRELAVERVWKEVLAICFKSETHDEGQVH